MNNRGMFPVFKPLLNRISAFCDGATAAESWKARASLTGLAAD